MEEKKKDVARKQEEMKFGVQFIPEISIELCSIKILNKIDINRYFFNMAKWIDLNSKFNILLHGGT